MIFMSMATALLVNSAVASAAADWKSQPAIAFDKTVLSKGKIGPERPSKYVTVDLPYEPFLALREEVQKRAKVALATRGEAHITLVTPPEFEKLVMVLAPAEIRGVFEKHIKSKELSEIQALCVGQSVKEKDQTWYVVIGMPSALKVRNELLVAYKKKAAGLVQTDAKKKELADPFRPNEFFPHVTLGFNSRDLHLQDGATKNLTTCKFPFY